GYAFGVWALMKSTDGGQTWVNQAANINTAWRNVIATRTGTVYPDQQVIICAHLDDVSEMPYDLAPGADDNGSGSVSVLEAARIFSNLNFERTLKFCLWGGEEEGLLGSGAYAAEASARGDNIVAVLNFDMIAWDGDLDDSMDVVCGVDDPSRNLGTFFMTILSDYNLQLSPEYLPIFDQGSDHAAFWEFNYPAIFISENFEGDFNPYYHTTADNIQHVNRTFLTNNVKAAIGATATLAGLDSASTLVHDYDYLPRETLLAYHYPNPFNASMTIKYSLPQSSDIRIDIYDLLGRHIETLLNEYQQAGEHKVTWHADRLPSGAYFYRFQTEYYIETRKMVLMK
ncbi:MAG: M20/M25/M40 family metallo-hydrolase, partial [Candidatus Zixiibacteriota bacterium]